MAVYELIGKTLGHSVSKPIHEALGAYRYHLRELPDEAAVAEYMARRHFAGCNVTIPYKQTVISLCDHVDERAARIGAVNTVVNKNGLLYGYNTDYDGLAYLLTRAGISLAGQKVLLLGSGGTSHTAMAVAQDAGAATVWVASRHPGPGQLSYEQAAGQEIDIVLNTSPAGMYPHNGEVLLDIAEMPGLKAVADVVYNPLKTRLVLDAEARGLLIAPGLSMLVRQAVRAAELFTSRSFAQQDTERVLGEVYGRMASLVIVGMPGSGKSKLGRAVARRLQKKFIDLDAVIEAKAGCKIAEIFEKQGEAAFRALETQALEDCTKEGGRVISTGGGVVVRPQNRPFLRQNGPVLYLRRPVDQLHLGAGRPLSTSREALQTMYTQRAPLYEAVADLTVENDASFTQVMHRIVEAYHAYLGA